MSARRPSPLIGAHRAAGGRDLDEAGLPADYGDAPAEYRVLRDGAGLVDLSDHDLLRASGRDHLSVLHAISTGVVASIEEGRGGLTVLTTPKGRVVDLVAVVRDDAASSLLICGAGAGETVATWIRRFVIMKDCGVEPLPPEHGLLAVRGPGADATAGSVLGALPGHSPWSVTSGADDEVRIIRGAAPGEPGILVVAPAARLGELRDALAGPATPCGRTAATFARLGERRPAYGREITEERNPWELRLDDVISMDKGCYVGQEVVARLVNYDKIRRRLALLEADADPAELLAAPVRVGGQAVGAVTSASRLGDTTLALTFLPVDADETAVEVATAPSAARVLDPIA